VKDPMLVRDCLMVCLRRWGIGDRVIAVEVKRLWKELMPPLLRKSSKVVEFRNGELIIRVSSSPLRTEIIENSSGIIERLNTCLGHPYIKKIVVR